MGNIFARMVGVFGLILAITVIFAVSACAPRTNMDDLQLTYIGETRGPAENIVYFLQGPADGEVVVLLPGMGRGACEFRELVAELNKAGYRTVAIQPRGIGRSGPLLTKPSYDQFAADIELVLNDVPGGVAGGRVHLLGYEFGNRVVRMFAVKYPERVGALVLLACGGQQVGGAGQAVDSPSPTTRTSPAQQVLSNKNIAVDPSLITNQIDNYFRGLAVNSNLNDPQDVTLSGMTAAFAFWLPPSEREQFVKRAFFAPMSKVPSDWITGWYRDTGWMQQGLDRDHSKTSADWVSGGSAPMLILNGQYDVAAPMANAQYMKKTYPDRVTLFEVPDAGHAMLAEQPVFISKHVIKYLRQYSFDK
ncbi:alpha/beta fold hydrolase [Desulfovibrio sp. JC010]|uniref:alpha/beta fold hydrolase n=1 Tax=Desulfovibrio sp. JC010 TaxID=2593641 RepID=UPI0013D397B5|nr:alpha/beta hydrolase [Desulfovibrio sp. JC010]